MNPTAGFTADREPEIRNCVPNPRPQDDTLEHIATSWGFNFVQVMVIAFLTAVAFHAGWDKTRVRNYGNTELRKRKKG